jgi:hypothetical protein
MTRAKWSSKVGAVVMMMMMMRRRRRRRRGKRRLHAAAGADAGATAAEDYNGTNVNHVFESSTGDLEIKCGAGKPGSLYVAGTIPHPLMAHTC